MICSFLIGLSFYCWVVKVLYIFRIQIVCHSVSFHVMLSFYSFLIVSFEAWKFLILMKSNFSLYFVTCISKKPLTMPRSWRLTPTFCSKCSIVSALKFKLKIHFELICYASAYSSYFTFHSPLIIGLGQSNSQPKRRKVEQLNWQQNSMMPCSSKGKRISGKKRQCQLWKVKERKEVRRTMASCLKDWLEGYRIPYHHP